MPLILALAQLWGMKQRNRRQLRVGSTSLENFWRCRHVALLPPSLGRSSIGHFVVMAAAAVEEDGMTRPSLARQWQDMSGF